MPLNSHAHSTAFIDKNKQKKMNMLMCRTLSLNLMSSNVVDCINLKIKIRWEKKKKLCSPLSLIWILLLLLLVCCVGLFLSNSINLHCFCLVWEKCFKREEEEKRRIGWQQSFLFILFENSWISFGWFVCVCIYFIFF